MQASSRTRRAARAEKSLTRESYTHLAESLVDQIGLEILAIDGEAHITLVNKKAARRLADPSAALGKSLFEIFPFFAKKEPVDWRHVITQNLLKEGRSLEVRDHAIGGRHYDIRAFPLAVGKRREGAALTLDDVTDKIEREEALVRQARTASLANLGASIAHEIRNPLNSIALNIQLLKEDLAKAGTDPRPDTVHRTIDTTLHGIERLNKIIKEFLQFSRPPQVVLKIDDPNRAVLSALQLLEGQIRKANVDVTVALAPVPKILIDAERLSEAIYNIALNAIQAMERSGSASRRVMGVTSALEDGAVMIRIRDSGPGIPPEHLGRLFDLFFTTREGGTGLGLPYADGVVKAHQGRVHVESRPGEGAVFTIAIPASIRMSRDATT